MNGINGFVENEARSFKVPYGYNVEFFSDDNLSDLVEQSSTAKNWDVYHTCINLSFSDNGPYLSSLRLNTNWVTMFTGNECTGEGHFA